jgi:hypothetical protein
MPMASSLGLTRNANQSEYWVVHPLDDLPEKKRDVSALGPLPMTFSVRFSLLALRGYLLLMTGLVAYHFLGLAAALRHLSN